MDVQETKQAIGKAELEVRQIVEQLESMTGLKVVRLEIGHCLYEGKDTTPVKIHAEL